ncbi:MAG TPA: M3 family metallopeptidase, partial [Candidatus Ozemobacteraceae bacterium]|nr:M3 family metallopeptidase [Candidatus Ozemobacteraceae bacterium]
PDGTRRVPSTAILLTVPPSTKGQPALLTHGDLEMLLHEFGHAFHHLFSQATYARLAGTGVSLDFAEVPSTLLEELAWDPTVLKSISRHHPSGRSLSDDEIGRLIRGRPNQSPLAFQNRLFKCLFDLHLHTGSITNTTDLYSRLQEQLFLIPMTPGTAPHAAFAHLMGGYDASTYAYPLATVLTADLLSAFSRKGLTIPAPWRRFRQVVLAPGRVPDEEALLNTFLGRPWSVNSFLQRFTTRH